MTLARHKQYVKQRDRQTEREPLEVYYPSRTRERLQRLSTGKHAMNFHGFREMQYEGRHEAESNNAERPPRTAKREASRYHHQKPVQNDEGNVITRE
jgi:hypothetical protein